MQDRGHRSWPAFRITPSLHQLWFGRFETSAEITLSPSLAPPIMQRLPAWCLSRRA